jgi:hypothetical protein
MHHPDATERLFECPEWRAEFSDNKVFAPKPIVMWLRCRIGDTRGENVVIAKAMPVAREGVGVPAQPKGRAHEERRVVNGQAVIADEPVLSNLPSKPPTKVRKLTLADKSVRYGCVQCPFTGANRDVVRVHFKREHGESGPLPERVAPPTPNGVVPERKASPRGRITVDPDAATMTLGELVQLATSATRFGAMIETEQALTAKWRKRAEDAEIKLRRLTVALDRAGFALKIDEAD